MKPVKFPGCNTIIGEKQPQFQPLPAIYFFDHSVLTKWELTDEEVETIVKNRSFYISQQTAGRGFQAILPMTDLGDDIIVKDV